MIMDNIVHIDSTEFKVDYQSLTPQIHVQFHVNLMALSDQLNPDSDKRIQDQVAYEIGQEVIRQAQAWHTLTQSNTDHV